MAYRSDSDRFLNGLLFRQKESGGKKHVPTKATGASKSFTDITRCGNHAACKNQGHGLVRSQQAVL
ncbi:hypothetical protein CPJ18_08225 [Agrobacterium rosae]|uniref:Uncharacterized protein n=1 Tax=Agrobacterium rosae TaxID=1972867 RepID=A0AAE5RYX2_9HYPH|nr:hypothetical protein CPJ18_08225 [Agrobacterium rosae]